jgi:hypothetical protein
MEVGQGPKVGCSAKGKKIDNIGWILVKYVCCGGVKWMDLAQVQRRFL